MAETATAAPAATPSASASSASAASAPTSSAPASTSTPAAGAPASTATSATPAPTTPANDTRTTQEILAEALAKGPLLVGEQKPAEAEKVAEAAPEPEAKKSAEGETDDPVRTAEEQAEIDAAAGEDKPAAGEDEDRIDFGFDDEERQEGEPVDPKALSTKIEADPALKAALDANPDLKNELFANARVAAKVDRYETIFSSPEEAEISAGMSETFGGIRNHMIELKPNDMAGTQQVINSLLEAASLRNEDGTVAKNPDGTYKSDGTIGRFLANAFEYRLKMVEAEAKKAGDEETLAALDTLMGRVGLRAAPSPGEEELSERERTLQQENQRLQQERQQQVQDAQVAHDKAVESRNDRMIEVNVNQWIDRATGLTDFNKSIVRENIGGDLVKAIQGNQRYQEELNVILRRPVGLAREKAEVALNAKWLAAKLPKIARARIAEAGAQVMASEKGKEAKQAARIEAAKGESRASMTPSRPASTLTGQALMDQIYSEFRSKNGRDPNTQEYLAEKMNRSSAAAA